MVHPNTEHKIVHNLSHFTTKGENSKISTILPTEAC